MKFDRSNNSLIARMGVRRRRSIGLMAVVAAALACALDPAFRAAGIRWGVAALLITLLSLVRGAWILGSAPSAAPRLAGRCAPAAP
mgnify:CR=1 FL=1